MSRAPARAQAWATFSAPVAFTAYALGSSRSASSTLVKAAQLITTSPALTRRSTAMGSVMSHSAEVSASTSRSRAAATSVRPSSPPAPVITIRSGMFKSLARRPSLPGLRPSRQ